MKMNEVNLIVHSLVFENQYDILKEDNIKFILDLGYKGIELIPISYEKMHYNKLLKLKEKFDFKIILGWSLDSNTSLISNCKEIRENGITKMKELINIACIFDVNILAGLNYAGCGDFIKIEKRETGLNNSLNCFSEIGEYALKKRAGLKICMEPAVRHESNLINTVDMGIEYIDKLGAKNVKLLLDTHNMLQEESDLITAFHNAGDDIGYIHLSESHRGTLGTGMVPWGDIKKCMRNLNSTIYYGVEGFISKSSVIANYARIWRNMEKNAFSFLKKSYAFINN